jgi:hypothetical protein
MIIASGKTALSTERKLDSFVSTRGKLRCLANPDSGENLGIIGCEGIFFSGSHLSRAKARGWRSSDTVRA